MKHCIGTFTVCLATAVAPPTFAQSVEQIPLPKVEQLGDEAETTWAVGYSPGGTYLWAMIGRGPTKLAVWHAQDRRLAWLHPQLIPDTDGRDPIPAPAWARDESAVAIPLAREADGYPIAVIDPGSGTLRTTIPGSYQGERISHLALSHDGGRLIVATGNGRAAGGGWPATTVAVHDLRRGELLASFEAHPDGPRFEDMALSRDGRLLATTSAALNDQAGAGLRLWEVHSGKPLFQNHAGSLDVRRVAFLGERQELLTVHNDGAFQIWDVTEPSAPQARLLDCKVSLNFERWSATLHIDAAGTRAALIGDDGSARIVGLGGEAFHPLYTSDARMGGSLSPDGEVLLTGGKTLRQWQISEMAVDNDNRVAVLHRLQNTPHFLGLSSDGRRLMVRSKRFTTLSAETGSVLGSLPRTDFAAFSPDRGRVFFWDNWSIRTQRITGGDAETLAPATVIRNCEVKGRTRYFPLAQERRHLIYGDNGKWMLLNEQFEKLAGGEERLSDEAIPLAAGQHLGLFIDGRFHYLDLENGDRLGSVELPHNALPAAFAASGSQLYGVTKGSCLVWRLDLPNGTVEYPFAALAPRAQNAHVRRIAVASAAPRVATAQADGRLRVWDTRSHACVATYAFPGELRGLAISADGKIVYAAGVTDQENLVLKWWIQ